MNSNEFSVGVLVGNYLKRRYFQPYNLTKTFNISLVSDSCASNLATDQSGVNLREIINKQQLDSPINL